MTTTNVFGPAIGRGMVRRWALEGLRLWLPDYVREAERQEGYPVGRAQLPRSFPVAPDLRKMPEEALPAVILQLPGLGERGVRRGAKGELTMEWFLAASAVAHGRDREDTERLGDVYGLALALLLYQQGGNFVTTPGYTGPALTVEAMEFVDLDFQGIAWGRSRTLVAATATVRVDIRHAAQAAGPLAPSLDPTSDPGAWPEVTDTDLTIEVKP